MDTTYYSYLDSPLGPLLLTGDSISLTGVYLPEQTALPTLACNFERDDFIFREARDQIRAYFKGKLFEFDLSLASDGTDYQKCVWQELRKIPYAQTATYGAIAKRLGNVKASRAVGLANSKNPISIVIPCHRIIGANGTLTGYAGGIQNKQWLLNHERGYARFALKSEAKSKRAA